MPIFWRCALLSGLFMLYLAGIGTAAVPAQDVTCGQAAEVAAQNSGVPLSVLQAITLAESGRKSRGGIRPWPWTVNMEGKGHWFDTYAEARAYVEQEYNRGARSFDVGCFQLNYRWHGEAFSSIDQMFDPVTNAAYAARFLKDLYNELGSWEAAAGAYHSRTKQFADKYVARFEDIRARMVSTTTGVPVQQPVQDIPDIVAMLGGETGMAQPAAPRVNTYPLLQRRGESRATSGAAAGASLVTGTPRTDAPPMPGSLTPANLTAEVE